MRTVIALCAVAILLTTSGALYPQERPTPTIAVVNFKNTSGSEALSYLDETISEYINTYLQATGRVDLVERGQLQEASLKELNLNLTDIVDAVTAAQLGRIVGAEFTIIGSFTKAGDALLVNARLIEVETAKAVPGAAAQERGREDELFNLLDRVSESLKKVILEGSGTSEPTETLSTLFIESNPPGASIYINGQSYGLTPKDIHNLKEGSYEVVLTREGYEPYVKMMNLSLGDEVPLTVDLNPQRGTLIIVSYPEEAEVYLDGNYQGKAKITIEDVLTGTHQVMLKKKGYHEEQRAVEVIYQETSTLEVTLKEKPGSLLVLSSPQGATVYLDDENRGVTPLTLSFVPPGEHTVKLTREGRGTHRETVTIRGEENTTVHVALSPNNPPKILSLTATPETIEAGATTTITCTATDPDGDTLSYTWSATGGSIQGERNKVTYKAPDEAGTYSARVTVTDNSAGLDTGELAIVVMADDLFRVVQNSKWGYIEKSGKIVIKPRFDDSRPFSEGLAAVRVDDRWGYIDKSGKIIIEPQFDWTYSFSEGLARVTVDDKSGYIDKSGKIVIKPRFDDSRPFSEGLAVVEIDEKYGYIDKSGKIIIEPQFKFAYSFSEGLACVLIDGYKGGFINTSGRFVIAPEFGFAYPFSEGLAAVRIEDHGDCMGYIDRTGRVVIRTRFDYAGPFSDGLAWVQSNAVIRYIDRSGRVVIEEQSERGWNLSDNSFSEGLLKVKIDGEWGYIDTSGRVVIEPQFDRADSFSEGLAWVKVGEKYGYIDRTGKYVWPPTN